MCENSDPPGERESFPSTTEFLQPGNSASSSVFFIMG